MVHLMVIMTPHRDHWNPVATGMKHECEYLEPFIEHQGERRGLWLWRPKAIGEKLLIAAKGSSVPDRHRRRNVVVLDAGTAFGTGGHGTTEGCLVALEKSITGEEAVLDVGTGTGILAIAAHKLGAGRVAAVDTDRAACVEARKNLALNGLQNGIELVEGGIDSADGQFDVIAANLRTHVLVAILGEIIGKLGDRGIAIVSGILERELHPFLAFVERYPLDIIEIKRFRGWMTLVSKKGC